MSDLSITAANVLPGTNASVSRGTAGASITAGQTLYKDAADSDKLKAADCNNGSAKAEVVGIALHAAASGQPLTYQTGGLITIGATVAVGESYWQSQNAGGIAPAADKQSGDYRTLIGHGVSTTQINIVVQNTGAITGVQAA